MSAQPTFAEFVAAVLAAIDGAAEAGNKPECVRLLRLLRDESEQQARRLEETENRREFRQWKPGRRR